MSHELVEGAAMGDIRVEVALRIRRAVPLS